MNKKIKVVTGDITKLQVDAIVNAANELMLGGGGVDGAIHTAAGPRLFEACQNVKAVSVACRCPRGEARITPGFNLSASFVIHTVGPVWFGGDSGEPEVLASCYRNSLKLAKERGVSSIAFPAISCGVYGYPVVEAAQVAVDTINEFLKDNDEIKEVYLVAFEPEVETAFREVVE